MKHTATIVYLDDESISLLNFLKYKTKKSKSVFVREACKSLKKRYKKLLKERE